MPATPKTQVMLAELPVPNGRPYLRVSVEAMPAGYRVVLDGSDINQVVDCENWSTAARWFQALVIAHHPRHAGMHRRRILRRANTPDEKGGI